MEFESFDSYEAMMDAINKAREEADKKVQPWQAVIMPGDFFLQATPYGFLIFGQVLEGEGEFYKSEEGKNYRFCKCYSVAVPEGEMGDVHVSVINLVIKEKVFNKFRDKGWVVEEGDTFD